MARVPRFVRACACGVLVQEHPKWKWMEEAETFYNQTVRKVKDFEKRLEVLACLARSHPRRSMHVLGYKDNASKLLACCCWQVYSTRFTLLAPL